MADPKQEQAQLEKISAQIKEKRAEVDKFNKEIKDQQDKLDKAREEVNKQQDEILTIRKELADREDALDKKAKRVEVELQEVQMKRLSLDKIAEASDERLSLAKQIQEQNEKTLREIERRSDKVEVDLEGERATLNKHIAQAEEFSKLKEQEYVKCQEQLEALKAERAEIQENKVKYENMVREITDTKGELGAKLNQTKDKEQELKKLQGELKNRETNCDNREQILKDAEIEIEAKWKQLKRKIEVAGFAKEIELAEGK